MACKTCKYWVQLQKELWAATGFQLGECHYNAPHPAWFKRNDSGSIVEQIISWPLTKASDFCSGETKKDEEVDKVIQPKKAGLLSTLFNSSL